MHDKPAAGTGPAARTGKDRDEYDRLRAAVHATGDLVYDWDLESDVITWSGRVTDVFGLAGPNLVGTGVDLEEVVHPEDRLVRREGRRRHIAEGTPFDCEYRLRRDSGEYCWVHDRGCAELSPRGKPVRFTGILRQINARKQSDANLDEKVSYDELTGHFNRVRLRDSLEQALAYCQRYETTGAYLCIGIDGLGAVNDAYGYESADAVVVGVGQILDRHLRASDVVGRMEGDRFGIVLPKCAEADMKAVSEKILAAIQKSSIETPAGDVRVTASAGGVAYPTTPGQTAHDIMRRSEVALQEAKQAGRNCFVPYQYSEQQQRQRRKDMIVALQVQQALKDDRLIFALQPVVRAQGFEPAFYECLVRMIDDKGRIVVAGEFIPVVERMGLARALDQRVLDMAINRLIDDPKISLAVNVSGLTAGDRIWLRLLVSRLKGKPELARRLIIEITETVALHDIEETASFVATVRNLGCRVALDDFGAGYTSFRHLQALAVDMVKIDGSFVRNLSGDLDNQLFVKTLLGLAEGFGLETVAECVETPEDVAFLVAQGVKYLQGYHFGRPVLDPAYASSDAGSGSGSVRGKLELVGGVGAA